jgi:hypothetical protein
VIIKIPSTARTANEARQAIAFGAAQFIMCTFASTMYNPNIENILMVAEFNPVATSSAGVARVAVAKHHHAGLVLPANT